MPLKVMCIYMYVLSQKSLLHEKSSDKSLYHFQIMKSLNDSIVTVVTRQPIRSTHGHAYPFILFLSLIFNTFFFLKFHWSLIVRVIYFHKVEDELTLLSYSKVEKTINVQYKGHQQIWTILSPTALPNMVGKLPITLEPLPRTLKTKLSDSCLGLSGNWERVRERVGFWVCLGSMGRQERETCFQIKYSKRSL